MKSKIKNYSYVILAFFISGGLLLSSCKTHSSKPSGPKPPNNPGGYDSSNQIAAANLQDFLTLNGSATDAKGHIQGTNSGGSFVSGMLSGTQAWQGSSSNYSYLGYPGAGTGLQTLTSFTVSAWIKANQPSNNPNAVVTPGLGEQCFFQLVNDSAWQSNIHLGLTSFTSITGGTTLNADTLQLKIILSNFGSGVIWQNYYLTADLDTAVGKWTNVVVTYSSATSMLNVYENGVAVKINGPYTPAGGSVGLELYQNDPGSLTNTNGAPPYGNLQFKNATAVVVGGWGINTTPPLSFGGIQPWAGEYTGAIERLRIYNSSLSATDVNSLYILEKAGF
ncbi:MAG TPA: hypothetical protein VMV20_01615 [Chitinophagaceae bacterium]|nr:hypothetical protein [Chitinophagaceae bacterium]